ncbi:MAG TPA: hypothetical protein VNU44_13590 [Bryobacteraceae bacterium]|jgi:hypothetical protein|nr:hypothetical protein [Bryobacteraceae bacterium]
MNSPSDFQITETPTLHFVATGDELRLSQDLQARLDDALRLAEEKAEVVAAAEAHRAASDRLQELKKAERGLHQYARESGAEMARVAQSALDAVIHSAAVKSSPNFGRLDELTAIEARNRFTARALERLVEHVIPLAQIAELRADSHELLTRARVIEAIAQERAERLLGQLRDAVSEEIVLPVDMSKGVAGALLAHAGGLKKLAVQQAENADRIEKSYTARATKEMGR